MSSVFLKVQMAGLLGGLIVHACTLPALAHGAVHEQIVALTREIEQNPRNGQLYLRRAELNRVHQQWDAAQADLETAAALEPNLVQLDLLKGRLFLEAGWSLSARVALDRFLARHTNNAAGFLVRARTLAKLGHRLAAAHDYARAIALTAEPGPELFIERSQVLAGEGVSQLDEAIRCLDEGIRRLGPLVTLELLAIDLEVKRRDFDAALHRIDGVAARSPRKETWLAKQGEILEAAGRPVEASRAYESALSALNTLPPARRGVPAMQELQKRIQEQIARLNGADVAR